MKRYAMLLLILATAPAMADRYENSSYTRDLTTFCVKLGNLSEYAAQKREQGFHEQAVSQLFDAFGPRIDNPRLLWDIQANVSMIYHNAGWSMSTPEQIARGAYENCMAQHGSETWWRQPAVAGAP